MTYTKDITKCETNYQIKKVVLVFKRLIQFLKKVTYNSFLNDKGTRNLYT